MSKTIPARATLAARRAFVRTTAQAYAAVIPAGGISAAALATAIEDPHPVQLAAAGIALVVSPLLAGTAAALSMIATGIPDEYVAAGDQAGQDAA